MTQSSAISTQGIEALMRDVASKYSELQGRRANEDYPWSQASQLETEFCLLGTLLSFDRTVLDNTLDLLRRAAHRELEEDELTSSQKLDEWLQGGVFPSWFFSQDETVPLLQIYSFYSQDGLQVPSVCAQFNRFSKELAKLGFVLSPEQIEKNTKTYIDAGATATTIDVSLTFIGDEGQQEYQMKQVEALHTAITAARYLPESAVAGYDPFLDSDDLP